MCPPKAFQPHKLSELDFWHWWADGQVRGSTRGSRGPTKCLDMRSVITYHYSGIQDHYLAIAIKRDMRRQMNKNIFLLLYVVCTWSLIICTCCSDRGTVERNLIFSHFLCLQLFGLTGYTKTRVDYFSRSRDGSNQLEPLELGTLKLNGYCQGIM